ncbi:hypothetical protein L6J92_13320 [Streptomyces sp. CB09030]|nr:TOPRIM nucleotidyl transferase/hydrolase domain-containing protein [Streptomyces sp. CB09030]UOG80115.1 hypothetical protein L6J92_13320 [Streptomyces sp. CB09030]
MVEIATDESVLSAFAKRQGFSLGAEGICVVNAEGKGNMILCHAILSGFGVRCHLVFDAGTGLRKVADADSKKKAASLRDNIAKNAKTLSYLRVTAEASPASASKATHTVVEDGLDSYLKDDWPARKERHLKLIARGEGYVEGKHGPTYTEAARTAGEPELLHELTENVSAMVRQPSPRA